MNLKLPNTVNVSTTMLVSSVISSFHSHIDKLALFKTTFASRLACQFLDHQLIDHGRVDFWRIYRSSHRFLCIDIYTIIYTYTSTYMGVR